ncbi:MAG: hypothetical protein IJE28_05015 [Oscillospiraceae bacterium]|nr:hypothetical protein [Oscillospiraceae bacterium]MBQ4644019.1 hypothetical protein [Oscillospiraceae bacterium]
MAKKEQNEFEIARKKRRKKFAAQRNRKFIGALLLLAILCTGIYFFVEEDVAGIIGDRIASSSSAGAGFPVDISGTNVLDTFTAGEHFGVLTDAVYYLYAENGKQLLSAQHDFANPIVESSGRRFLIYDQGGNRLFVRMRDKILFEKEFEYKIISADLSADGMLSVVTSAQRYASQLHVFDSDYKEEIFTWSSSDEYIVCASADERTKTVAAAALSANEAGEIVTNIHIFTTEAAVELSEKEFKGSSVLSLEYDSDGDVKIICDNLAATISKDGEILGSFGYSSVPAACMNLPGTEGAAVVFDRFTEARATDVLFLFGNFAETKNASVSGKYICSDRSESNTAVYCSGTAFVFDNRGESTAVLESEKDAVLVEILRESLLAVTRDQLCRVEK